MIEKGHVVDNSTDFFEHRDNWVQNRRQTQTGRTGVPDALIRPHTWSIVARAVLSDLLAR